MLNSVIVGTLSVIISGLIVLIWYLVTLKTGVMKNFFYMMFYFFGTLEILSVLSFLYSSYKQAKSKSKADKSGSTSEDTYSNSKKSASQNNLNGSVQEQPKVDLQERASSVY